MPGASGIFSGGPARAFFGLALAVLIGFVAYVGRGVVIPLLVAGFLSFLIFTLKQTIRSGPLIGRFLPDWLCYLFAFAAIVSAVIFFVEIIRDNVEALVAAAPLYEARLREFSQEALSIVRDAGILPEDFVGGVDELRQAVLGAINPALAQIGQGARSLTANIVTIFLYTVFMLIEQGRIFRKIDLVSADPARREAVNAVIGDIGRMVREYVAAKTASNFANATISYFILRFVGVDFAGFWALMIFLLTFIPIVGSILAISAPVILALVQPTGGAQTALLTLVLLAGTDQILSSVVEPRLIGKSLNLSPLVVLMSLAAWGTLWGFAGLLLGVPITVTLMIILTQFPATRPVAVLLSDDGKIAPLRRAS
jgi:predicted PurR-regulated permease PerM